MADDERKTWLRSLWALCSRLNRKEGEGMSLKKILKIMELLATIITGVDLTKIKVIIEIINIAISPDDPEQLAYYPGIGSFPKAGVPSPVLPGY